MNSPSSGNKAEELRQLLRIAKQLRDYCRETDDPEYATLFLSGAEALEERARRLAYGPDEQQKHVNIIC